MALISKWLMPYFYETSEVKAASLHFNHIFIVWFHIHCAKWWKLCHSMTQGDKRTHLQSLTTHTGLTVSVCLVDFFINSNVWLSWTQNTTADELQRALSFLLYHNILYTKCPDDKWLWWTPNLSSIITMWLKFVALTETLLDGLAMILFFHAGKRNLLSMCWNLSTYC